MCYQIICGTGVSEACQKKAQNITNQPGFIMAAFSAKPLESKIAPSLLACDLSDMAGEAARGFDGVEIKFARWRRGWRFLRLTG